MAKKAVALCAIGPVVFAMGWPWLWHDSFARLYAYFRFHLSHYPVDVYYLGHMYHYAPWHYVLVLTVVTMPLTLLVLVAAGAGFAGARVRGKKDEKAALLLVCAGAYLLVSSLPGAPKYNGVRLFMPAFPFLAGLAGIGFAGLCAWLGRIAEKAGVRRAWVACGVGAAVFGGALAAVAATHPYQLAYYNALVGGMSGARRLGFETIYWGGPYLEALPRLNEKAGTVYVIPKGAVSYLELYQRMGALRGDIRFEARGESAEATAMALKRSDRVVFQCAQSEFDEIAWALYRMGRPAWQVEMSGVPLVMAFDARQTERLIGDGARGR